MLCYWFLHIKLNFIRKWTQPNKWTIIKPNNNGKICVFHKFWFKKNIYYHRNISGFKTYSLEYWGAHFKLDFEVKMVFCCNVFCCCACLSVSVEELLIWLWLLYYRKATCKMNQWSFIRKFKSFFFCKYI